MTLRSEVVDCRSHRLTPHVAGVAMILRPSNYLDYEHAPRPISRRRLKQQLVVRRNSFRHCKKVLHRLVAERNNSAIFQTREACATCLRTRFDCSFVRSASWLTNQHCELSRRQIFLGANLHPEIPCLLGTEFPSAISHASRRRGKPRSFWSRARAATTARPSAGCVARAVYRGRRFMPCSPTSSRASTERPERSIRSTAHGSNSIEGRSA